MADAIERTIELLAPDVKGRVHIEIGDETYPPPVEGFDLVYAGEVLEHIWDWRRFVMSVLSQCAAGAVVIFTTPKGMWEDQGAQHEHLHHWDLRDWVEVFQRKTWLTLTEVTTHQPGIFRGWICARFAENGAVLGRIDYRRKLQASGFPEMSFADAAECDRILTEAPRRLGLAG